MPIMGSMAFIRKKTRKLASGETRDYFYEVESYWDGKPKQRVLKYLGTSPFPNVYELDPEVGGQVAQALFSEQLSSDEAKERLKNIGISLPEGELKEVSLTYNPPLKKLTVRVVFT
jgi:hypothetical protein